MKSGLANYLHIYKDSQENLFIADLVDQDNEGKKQRDRIGNDNRNIHTKQSINKPEQGAESKQEIHRK
jgi:hypothetical protein